MKILLTSFLFSPSVGGIETVSMILAREFIAAGHEVKVATLTPGETVPDPGFEIMREPGFAKLRDAMRWCDVCFQSNISLQLARPLLLVRRPWIIVHHTWISAEGGPRGLAHYSKMALLRFARSIAISRAIADELPVRAQLIPNPYDSATFYLRPDMARTKPLVAVGRLVSDKGFDVLFRALARLRKSGHETTLTLIGSGPEKANLENLAETLGVRAEIDFAGALTGPALAEQLNAHEIMVIPSKWREPFGVVALEGIACGCVAVGSRDGGLADAIGPCGLTFANGDDAELAAALGRLLEEPGLIAKLREPAEEHLRKHQPKTVARNYLDFFEAALRN